MKKITVIALVFVAMASSAFAQEITPSYRATVKKMMEVGGTQATFKSAIKQMFEMFKQQKGNVPDNIWADLEAEISKTSVDDLVEMLTPVYAKHLTEADLQKVIEFYQTPAGKKYADKAPLLTQESMQVGQQWGMKVAQKFQEKLKEKGY
jgi:uncharacterized protein